MLINHFYYKRISSVVKNKKPISFSRGDRYLNFIKYEKDKLNTKITEKNIKKNSCGDNKVCIEVLDKEILIFKNSLEDLTKLEKIISSYIEF